MMIFRPFEYFNHARCTMARLEDIGNGQWQYTLRQIFDCQQECCRWNEVVDITIILRMNDCNTPEAIKGVRRTWRDVNFRTTHQHRIADEACRTNPCKYKQYLKSCQDYTTTSLLEDIDVLQDIRPEVHSMTMDVCNKVVYNLSSAFHSF
jgi:hypothetical protein